MSELWFGLVGRRRIRGRPARGRGGPGHRWGCSPAPAAGPVRALIGLGTTALFLYQYSRVGGGIDRFYSGFTNAVGATAFLLVATAVLPPVGRRDPKVP